MTFHPASQAALERLPAVHVRRSHPARVLAAMRGRLPGQAYDFATRAGLSVSQTAHALSSLAKRGQAVIVERRCATDGGHVYGVSP